MEERKEMFMASLQVQQPLGQDSVISLTEMERCLCQNRGFSLFSEVNNLESFAESKQTAGRMRETLRGHSIGLNVVPSGAHRGTHKSNI